MKLRNIVSKLFRGVGSGQAEIIGLLTYTIAALIIAVYVIPALIGLAGPSLNTTSAINLLENEGYVLAAPGAGYNGDFWPAIDNTYKLGLVGYEWSELHVEGGSIYLGNVTLTDSGGCLATNEYRADGDAGEAGYLKLAFGTAPTHNEAGRGILWVDSSENLQFQKADGTDLEIVKLDSSGSLGIGITNPTSKLHLADVGSLQLILDADTDNSGEGDVPTILFKRDGGSDSLIVGVEGVAGTAFTGSLDNTPYLEAIGSKSIQFATDGTLAMEVDDSQDVTIKDVLKVENEIRLNSDGHAGDPGYTWESDADTGLFRGGTNILAFTTAGSEAVRIDSSGKVGIGTAAPDSIFHIKANTPGTVGSHPAGQLIIQDPDDTVFGNVVITAYESDGAGNPDQQLWYLGSSSGSNTDITFLNRRNANLHLGTNGVSRLTILGNGNIGIGASTIPLDGFPKDFTAGGTLLEIGDGTKDCGITFRSRTSGGNAFDIWQDWGGINLYIDSRRNDDISSIYFRTKTNGTPVNALTIRSNGYIDMPGVYAETTGSGANVFVASDGSLRRSTSSREFKRSIDYEGIDPYMALQFKPVSFEVIADGSLHLGFIAEDMRSIDPRLATSDDLPGLEMNAIVATLTALVQELEERLTILEAQNE